MRNSYVKGLLECKQWKELMRHKNTMLFVNYNAATFLNHIRTSNITLFCSFFGEKQGGGALKPAHNRYI
jgi:hypothetical protein